MNSDLTTLWVAHPFGAALSIVILIFVQSVWFLVLAVVFALIAKLIFAWVKYTGLLLSALWHFVAWFHFYLQARRGGVRMCNLAWSLAQPNASPLVFDLAEKCYDLGILTLSVADHRLAVALGKMTSQQYADKMGGIECRQADAIRAKLA